MGRSLPWPTDFDLLKMIVAPANNLIRRVSMDPVHPTQSWWNDYNGHPTGFVNPRFEYRTTPGVDDFAFPAVPNTSAFETIQRFNETHNDPTKVVTVFQLISFLTKNNPLLHDLVTVAESPSVAETKANNTRVRAWHDSYMTSLEKEGNAQRFGRREDDFSYHDVSASLKSVAMLSPQLLAVIRNSELNDATSKTKKKKEKRTHSRGGALSEDNMLKSESGEVGTGGRKKQKRETVGEAAAAAVQLSEEEEEIEKGENGEKSRKRNKKKTPPKKPTGLTSAGTNVASDGHVSKKSKS